MIKAIPAFRATRVGKVYRVIREPPGIPGHKVIRAGRASKATKVGRDYKATRVIPVTLVFRVIKVGKDHKASKEIKAGRVTKAGKVMKARERRATKAIRVGKVQVMVVAFTQLSMHLGFLAKRKPSHMVSQQ